VLVEKGAVFHHEAQRPKKSVEDWGSRNYDAGGLCAIVVDQDRGALIDGADYRRECYAIGH
jgi:hypothetical protein